MTSIDFDSTEQLYTVTANHWEPLDYISNVMQEEKKKNKNDNDIDEKLIHYRAADSSANVGATFIQVATIGATITGLILKIILPFLFRVLPQYADIYQQLISNQVVLLIFIIISTSIIILYTPLYNIAYPKVTQHAPIYTDRFKSIQQQQQQSKIKSSFQILPAGRDGGREVTVDEMKIGGSGSSSVMQGQTVEIEKLRTRYIINCAGCYSDKIAAMIGDHSFKIKPRIGNYILLNRNQGHLTRTTLFPCPHPVLGKGVLVQTTLWGNLILGPTARDMVSNVMKIVVMLMMIVMMMMMMMVVTTMLIVIMMMVMMVIKILQEKSLRKEAKIVLVTIIVNFSFTCINITSSNYNCFSFYYYYYYCFYLYLYSATTTATTATANYYFYYYYKYFCYLPLLLLLLLLLPLTTTATSTTTTTTYYLCIIIS